MDQMFEYDDLIDGYQPVFLEVNPEWCTPFQCQARTRRYELAQQKSQKKRKKG